MPVKNSLISDEFSLARKVFSPYLALCAQDSILQWNSNGDTASILPCLLHCTVISCCLVLLSVLLFTNINRYPYICDNNILEIYLY